MTTAEPFKPDPNVPDDRPAAADPGQGAPPPAEGFGVPAEEPDVIEDEGGREDG